MSIREMTEAQKATLRYTAMVEQAADMGAIGDMSRTLMTPANAIRILKQQLNELTRSLGSLFIPILMKVIPYVQAFVRVLTDAAQALAAIVGFTLPKIDYSGVKGLEASTEDVTSGLDDATESAKALKSQVMGFDELNVVNQNDNASASASTGNGYGSDLGLDIDSIWDESIFKNIESQVDDLMPKMKGLAIAIGAVSTAWAGIKVGTWISTVAGFLGNTAFVQNLGAFVSLLREGCGLVPTLEAAFPTLTTSLTALGAGSLGAGLAVIAVALVAIGSAIYYVVENMDQIKRVVGGFFELEIAPKLDSIKESFRKVGETLKPIADFFSPVITAVKTFITETLGIKSIGSLFEFLGGVVFNKFASGVAGVFNAMVTCVTGFASIISGVVTTVSGVIDAIVAIFKGDLPAAKQAVDKIFGGIVSVFTGLWNVTVGPLIEYVKGVVGWFTTLMTDLVGEDSVVVNMINSIVTWFASLPTKILGGLGKFCSDVAKKFIDVWGDIKDWFTKNVKPKFTKEYIVGLLSGLKTGVANALNAVKKTFSEKWTAIKTWWTTSVAPKFTKDYWSDIFTGIKDGFIAGIKAALNKGIDMLNNFIGWVNSKMSFTIPGFSIAGHELWGSTPVTLMTLPKITQRFADGGFIEDGLFTMNRGEIAGKFNNGKSVVANNEQIIAGISEGVYSAVVAAMANGGNRESQNVNVYLDGKQIYSSVKRTESERGKQIFGNQLGYGY